MDVTTADVLVIGAGVIGLAVAWRCSQRGLTVTVIDPKPGSGASWTAAGMLAPVTELHYGEQALLALNLDSADRYRAFAAELAQASGQEVGYRRCGTVVVAWDGADLQGLVELQTFAASLGEKAELVTGSELRKLVPALAPGLPGGLLAPNDHQVDNRLLHSALLQVIDCAGVRVIADRVRDVVITDGNCQGVTLGSGGFVPAMQVVLAAGAWSSQIGIPGRAIAPIRPVKGQTLRLRLPAAQTPDRIVRGSVKGSSVYVVPRSDGEVIVGATSEEAGFDLSPRAGAVYELLRDAQSLLPGLSEAELLEVSTSVRPGSADNAPLIGRSDVAGLLVATGHYRNGILLTPTTADTIAELVADGTVADVIAPFAPSRFGHEAHV